MTLRDTDNTDPVDGFDRPRIWRNRWHRGPLELIAEDYLSGIPVKTISATHKVSPRAIRRTVQQRDLPRRRPYAFGAEKLRRER